MIGVLYESDEWSDHKLAAELEACGAPARLLNLEEPESEEAALACDMLVSRVFASARFRGHEASLERMPRIVRAAEARGIPLVNPGRAHFFEVDKRLAAEELAAAGVGVPAVLACGLPESLEPAVAALAYPCIVKPNCGGRSTHTAVARTEREARAFLRDAPPIEFIVEEYVEPVRGFLTRAELVDGALALVVKRSVAENGLSSYHFGSTYAPYPDVPAPVAEAALRAGAALDIAFGSFDIIEGANGPAVIDANSVSNVSADCTELLGIDLMRAYAQALALRWRTLRAEPPTPRTPPRPARTP